MPVKRFVKKQGKKLARTARNRYTTRSGGMRINRLAKDVMTIKRSLNVEHKHFDYKFGSGQSVSAQLPTNNDPITLALPLPQRGVAYNNRIGNQIRITHIASKIEFLFKNTSDLVSRTTASVRLLFAKAGDDVPTIEDLYEVDQNGHYTRASFTNSQEWKKYNWIKPLNSFKSHTDQLSRFPLETLATGPEILPSSTGVNLVKYYVNKQTKTDIRVMFENGSDTICTQMKPYLLIMSDCIVQDVSGFDKTHDPVSITGTIRFTYVDN